MENNTTQSNNGTGTFTPKFAPKTTRPRSGSADSKSSSERGSSFGRRGGNGKSGDSRKKFEKVKPEFDQKIVSIRRVTRVVAGGRRFSFAVAMLIGDKNGKIGFGTGKSNDTTLAITKALQDAKKHMVSISRTKGMSIPHEVEAKYNSSQVWLAPNKDKGLVCGSAIRDIFTLAGMTDITAKIHTRSKNKINNVRATLLALSKLPQKKMEAKVVAPVESSLQESEVEKIA